MRDGFDRAYRDTAVRAAAASRVAEIGRRLLLAGALIFVVTLRPPRPNATPGCLRYHRAMSKED
jgi:hypothetical protein